MKVLSLSSFLLFIFVCLAFLSFANAAACPHSDSSLVAWSTVPRLNVANAKIVVAANERFLLDKSPAVFIQSIEIDGEVVVANSNIALNVSWIKVNVGGAWTAGASNCRITSKVVLTFFGDRTDANVIPEDSFDSVAFGTKGFVVATGGTLMLFGAQSGPTWARLSSTANINDTSITLDQDVKWKAGDTIVVTSTDFPEALNTINSSYTSLNWLRGSIAMPDQSESVTIKSISGRTITLSRPLDYMHWGVGVQRAEVALLTHNIVFQGDEKSVEQEFGGHLMMRKAKFIHIEGVEFTRFGQRGVLGRYPVHFHVQREVIGMEFSVVRCSIHNNFQRSLVIHESHGVEIEDVVGYKTLGHMFFLEDGGERMNTLNRVIGISASPVAKEEIKYGKFIQIIPTDSDVSIFWITNMNNTITNCVAVGGKFGFWQLMPSAVTGPSKFLYPAEYNPRRVGVASFRDNIAHSCSDTGFEFDNYLTDLGTTEEGAYSPSPMPVFSGLIAYKCRQFGIWGKSSMEFYDLILMDNRRSLMVNGATIIHDSLFVGESDNYGRIIPRRGHERSFPDQNGGNTSKICGHESYDNGGPQYSYNNRFVNFVSTATRKAGALCPLQTGPFMLDTKNRVFNLTFENANRVHVGSPRTGDNEYGWTVLDNDGSVTEMVGGGWIVSQNASHLLNDDCVHRPDWEAWICPPFAGGYVQLTITSQITSTAPTIHLNGTDIASAAIANTRNTRAIFHEMGANGKFGKVLGARLDCYNKTKDACFQFMHNVIPRKFYTIRFMLNDFYIQTPSSVLVNMHSSFPGDYVFVAIPYPTNAAPFNISYGTNLYCSQVASINALNATTYFYDANTEHLYLRIKTSSNNVVNRNGNLTDYGGSGLTYLVQTSCSKCAPTESKVKTIPRPPTLSLKEDEYQADLQTCQVAGRRASYGVGSSFFWFYPETRELHYNIYHDLPLNFPTGVSLGMGKFGERQYIMNAKNFRGSTSPLRGIFTLTGGQWADLAKGNLFVEVRSKDFPDGHLRGQILCKGTCDIPPAIANVDPCVPTGRFVNILNGTISGFSDAFGNDNTTRVYSSESLCANASIQINMKTGYYQLNGRTPYTVVGSTYKFLEFYVKALPGSGEFPLYVQLSNVTHNQRLAVTADHINNYAIDEFYGWTRVKMPFSDFTVLPDLFNLSRIQFTLVDTSLRRDFLIDQVRVIAGGNEPTKPLVASSEVAQYTKSLCENTGTSSGVSTTGNTGNTGPTTTTAGEVDPTAIPDINSSASSSSSVFLFFGMVAILLALF